MESFQHELLGAEKKTESVFSLIQSLSILWTNHYQVHVQFSSPVALSDMVEGEFSKQKFQEISQNIFGQVQMNKTTTVSSLMAVVLLSTTKAI